MPSTASAPSIATAGYDSVARMLHWLMAFLILAVFLLGLLVDSLPKAWKYGSVETHKALGVGLLLLIVVRFGWRLINHPPASESVSPMLDRAARLGHFALYALMLAVPVIGVVYTALRGQGIDFGLFSIPPIMERNRELGRTVREIHELAAYALIGLASLHALAALWHHFIRRDATLLRMLPARR